MILSEIILIAGDTSRSRCYLQALMAKQLFPLKLILLPSQQSRPGQVNSSAPSLEVVNCDWGRFDPMISIEETAKANDLPVLMAPSSDINDPEVVRLLSEQQCLAYIYSGFGGVLLRRDVLACGKKFLHIHGGWLPDYKGSTTNHFSALEKGFCGASAIFLTERIDEGEILARKKFAAPADLSQLDHVYDALYRTEVLIEVISDYAAKQQWPSTGIVNVATDHYYIMHPVLRHVLILRQANKA